MFTGLVEGMGEVLCLEPRPPGVRLVLRHREIAADAGVGDSIAINGCCLTVVRRDGESLHFDAGEETLKRTNLGRLTVGQQVNLERSLRFGDRLGGHLVTGHIDATGTLDERRDDADWSYFFFRVPGQLTRQMASKGSVAVDGVSLTLVDVEAEQIGRAHV